MVVDIVGGVGIGEGGGVDFELFESVLLSLLLLLLLLMTLLLSLLLSLLLALMLSLLLKTASAASAHVGSGGNVDVLAAGAGHICLSLVVVAEEILLARALVCKKRVVSERLVGLMWIRSTEVDLKIKTCLKK